MRREGLNCRIVQTLCEEPGDPGDSIDMRQANSIDRWIGVVRRQTGFCRSIQIARGVAPEDYSRSGFDVIAIERQWSRGG